MGFESLSPITEAVGLEYRMSFETVKSLKPCPPIHSAIVEHVKISSIHLMVRIPGFQPDNEGSTPS